MLFNNRSGRSGRFIFFPLIAVVILLVLGSIVMVLWNAVLPAVLNTRPINYRQSLALLILCRILFGNFGRTGRSSGRQAMMNRGKQWREKLMRMTPEERERFREQWKNRCRQPNK